MNERLPTKLNSEPIVDAICELRFEAAPQSAVNLLPGMMFEKYGNFEEIEKLGISELPAVLLLEESLKYQPHLRLRNANRYISIGPNMISASHLPPYGGWANFSAFAFDVFSVLKDRGFIESFTRISLRYTDIIDIGEKSDLSLLDAEIRLGKFTAHDTFQVRAERKEDSVHVITQIAGPATSSDGRKGVVVDVDTSMEAPHDFWGSHAEAYKELHSINKSAFFGMLKSETVDALKPEY